METPTGISVELQAQERSRIKTMDDLKNLDFDEIFSFYSANPNFRPTKDDEETL